MTLKEFLSGIANAIRGVEGSSGSIPAASFAERIAALKASFSLQSKTVTPTTSAQTVTADDGYDGLEQVTVSAMPSAVLAAPTVSVDGNGLITAKVTQGTAGYIASGATRIAVSQLTAQPGKTVTPGTSQQVAVAQGAYTTGPVYVAGDDNLVAENIKSGVSIFGVTGSLSAGTGVHHVCITDCNSLMLDLTGGCTELVISNITGLTASSTVLAVCGWFEPKSSYEFSVYICSGNNGGGSYIISELDDVGGIGDVRFEGATASAQMVLTEDDDSMIYDRISKNIGAAFAPGWVDCCIHIFWTD